MAILLCAAPVGATTFTVDDIADTPDASIGDGSCATATATCTLRAASQEASATTGSDEIHLPSGTYTVGGTLTTLQPLTIVGAGSATTILDGAGGESRLLSANAHLVLSGVTVRNSGGILAPTGLVTDCAFTGNAGAMVGSGMQISFGTILRSTFTNNTADFLGGALAISSGEVRDSTFASNAVLGTPFFVGGDAIATGGGGMLVIANSTIEGDVTNFSFCTPPPSTCSGGTTVELRNVTGGTAHLSNFASASPGSITVRNSIMTSCLASGLGIVSAGHNLFVTTAPCTVNPMLGDLVSATPPLDPLADNGGATSTRLPLASSAPIDGGGMDCEPTDQRGVPRPIGGGCDIGAVESGCGNGVIDAGEACDDANFIDGDGCDHNCTPTGCGNGVVTGAETCDDGDATAGDCCDASCQIEAAGSVCDDDGNACTDNVCSSIGVCVSLPNSDPCDDGNACTTGETCSGGTCRGGAAVVCGDPCLSCYAETGCEPRRTTCIDDDAGKSVLRLHQTATGTSDRLTLRWNTSNPVGVADFVEPGIGVSTQLVCVYDGNGNVVLHAYPNGDCGGSGCWSTAPAGFTYRDPSATADGIFRIALRAGPPEGTQASINVRGKGPNLAFVTPGPLVLPVRAVFETSTFIGPFPYTTIDRCFDATFDTGVTTNTGERFFGRSE